MRPIFISYRRDDTEGQAGRLFEHLREVFGAENVFMDVATLEPGVDFRRAIEKSTASCGVLLALIGRNWLTIADSQGQRRLDDPSDFVRLETAAALKRDIPVVPVLVQGAPMPRADQLPADLHDLAFRNSVELTHARWDSDVELLSEGLRKLLARDARPDDGGAVAPASVPPARPLPRSSPASPPATSSRPSWLLPAIGVTAALVVAAAGWLALRDPEPAPTQVATPPAARVAPPASTPAASAPPVIAAASVPVVAPPPPPPSSSASTAVAGDDAAQKAEEARRAAAQRKLAEQRRLDQQRKAAELRQAEQLRAAQEEERRAEDARQAEAASAAAQRAAQQRQADATRQAQIRAHNNGVCISGYVWREARPGDTVCVAPDVRARTGAENNGAALRREPSGGSYGANTCRQGYVWREAYAGDVVCVLPASRQAAKSDNAQAAQRVVPLPP